MPTRTRERGPYEQWNVQSIRASPPVSRFFFTTPFSSGRRRRGSVITLMKMIAGTGVSVITQLVTRSNGISIPLSSRTAIVPARGGVIEIGPRGCREFDVDSFSFSLLSLSLFAFLYILLRSSRSFLKMREWVTAEARGGKRMYVGHRVAQLVGNLTRGRTMVRRLSKVVDEVNKEN